MQMNMRSMACWYSNKNPSTSSMGTILYATHRLIQALQSEFQDGQIAIPSRDDKANRRGVEICVFFDPVKCVEFTKNTAAFLTKKATEFNLQFSDFVLQPETMTLPFSDEQLGYISKLRAPIENGENSENIDEAFFEKLVSSLKSELPKRGGMNHFRDVPSSQALTAIPLLKEKMIKLKSLKDDALTNEIQSVFATVKKAGETPNSAMRTLLMMAGGLSAIAGSVVTAISAYETVLSVYYLCCIAAALVGALPVVATIAVILAALALFGSIAYLAVKSARNVLLVINDTSKDILANMEDIGNGERTGVSSRIPAASKELDMYYAGVYVYDKWSAGGISGGFFGSCFGISYSSDLGDFSVGMDCPNSPLGGRNSIAIHTGEHAHNAMVTARDEYKEEMKASTPNRWIQARIADPWGNINWGLVVVDEVGF